MKKRLLAALLCVCLSLCLLPAPTYAAESTAATAAEFTTALGAANSGDTIKLTGSFTTAAITITKNLTLDLNNCTITFTSAGFGQGAVTVTGTASFTIKDTSEGAGGALEMTGAAPPAIQHSSTGTVTVEGGSISAVAPAIYNTSTGTVSVTGGEVYSSNSAAIYNNAGGAVSVSGGKVWSNMYSAIYNNAAGSITISGTALLTSPNTVEGEGTVTLKQVPVPDSDSDSDPKIVLTISGGSVANTSSGGYAVCFSPATVTAGNLTEYLTYTGGTVGRIYPVPALTLIDNEDLDLPAGVAGTSYTSAAALFAYGGTAPYTFSVDPAVTGLSIVNNKLTYAPPAAAGTQTVTVKVTDSAANTATITVNIGRVTPPALSAPTGIAWNIEGNACVATWNKVTGADGYEVLLFKGGNPSHIKKYSVRVQLSSCDVTDEIIRHGGGTYYFRVYAKGNNRTTGDSAESADSGQYVYTATRGTFNAVTANGSDTARTTQLTLTFGADIAGLTAADIVVSGAVGRSLAKVEGETGKYLLYISDIKVADGENVTVQIKKFGYYFSTDVRNVAVRNIADPPPLVFADDWRFDVP